MRNNQVRDSIADIMLELDELMRKSGKQLRKEIVQKYRKILLTHQVILDDFKRIPSPIGGGHTNFDYINKDLYLIEDYSLFDDFIYVLKYLKSENYIVVEEDKKKSQDIFRFFIYKYENEDKPRPSLESDYIRLLQVLRDNLRPFQTTNYFLVKIISSDKIKAGLHTVTFETTRCCNLI